MVIFNEKEHAEKMLKQGFITPNQEIKDLFILAKYLWYIQNSEDEIHNRLQEFIFIYKPEYSENVRNGIIKKTISSAKRGKLVFDKKIHIYKNELDKIQSLNDITLERLLFTYLVLSKFFNGLFKVPRADIFRLAKLDIHNLYKPRLIYKLNQTGLTITTTKKGKALRGVNIKPKGDSILEFIIDENFIYQYLFYICDKNVMQCKECGELTERKNNKQKYCDECKKKVKLEQTRCKAKEGMQRLRHVKKIENPETH